jgi:purine-binding chemotaxis protein CheW
MSDSNEVDQAQVDAEKYVVFRLADEWYGANLLDVREVVESVPVKPVPNTISAFKGVCNLRGQIIGVLDLRERFGLKAAAWEKSVLLVFETETGAIASAVDQIMSVSSIPKDQIEFKPNVVALVPTKYIQGIGKLNDRLVTLLDLKKILNHVELTELEQTRLNVAI